MIQPAPYAVLLAAGAGTRFGGAKLLAPLHGRPLVAHSAMTIAAAIQDGLLAGGVAVVPRRATALIGALETAGLTTVENPEAASGFASSLQRGLAALEPQAEAALIVLADQPLIGLDTIATLVEWWRERRRSVRPRYARKPDEPGHPVLLDRSAWPLVDRLSGDTGLAAIFRARPDAITILDVPGVNPDVDTPPDLHALEDSR